METFFLVRTSDYDQELFGTIALPEIIKLTEHFRDNLLSEQLLKFLLN